MGSSTRYSSGNETGIRDRNEDEAPSLAMSRHHEDHDHDNDIGRILRDIRDTLAAARADIAELLRRAAPPNDHP